VKNSASTSAGTGPYHRLVGSSINAVIRVAMRITPVITAPSAVQRAFNITIRVKISTSKAVIESTHMNELDKPTKNPVAKPARTCPTIRTPNAAANPLLLGMVPENASLSICDFRHATGLRAFRGFVFNEH
jgi:hypothetical protein